MKEIKNVIICGLGAIGTAVGEKILQTQPNFLNVLVDESRLQKYTLTPRILNGKTLNFNYITPDNLSFKADLIIIAVKSNGLKDVINNLKNFVNKDTIIISLLNGVTSEALIAEAYGWDKILPAYYIGSSAMRSGEKIIHDGIATIVFGAKDASTKEKELAVKDFFEKIGFNYKIPNDITRSLWAKFMLNVACNQISAILGLRFKDMQENPFFKELATNVMKEVLLCAKAEGVNNTETLIEEVFEHINTITPDGKTSMLQDIEAKRETEVEIFAGSVIEFGKKHNIPTPLNEALLNMIKTIQTKNELMHSENLCKNLQ